MATHATTTVIGRGTRVRGRVTGAAIVEMHGHVEGEVAVSGDVLVDGDGAVAADIRARRIVVRGAVNGDLTADEAILLEDGATRRRRPARAAHRDRARRSRPRLRADRRRVGRRHARAHASRDARLLRPCVTLRAALVTARRRPLRNAGCRRLARTRSPRVEGPRLDARRRERARAPVVPALKKGTKAALTKRR